MSDVRRGPGLEDEERLPWLEAVEEDDRGPSPLKLILAVLLGLAAIAAVVSAIYFLGNRGAPAGEEVIASPGAYKMRPTSPGGMQVDNQSGSQVATSEGAETNASIDRSAAPEAPVTRPQPAGPGAQPQGQQSAQSGQSAQSRQPAQPQVVARPPAQQQAQAQRPARPQPSQEAARPSGPTIQIGAFPSQAVANAEWSRLSGRYPYLGGLQRNVTVYQRGGQTFYRLRASGAEAGGVCSRLRAAGQPCMAVN